MSIFNQAKMENLLTYLLNTSLIVYCTYTVYIVYCMYNCSWFQSIGNAPKGFEECSIFNLNNFIRESATMLPYFKGHNIIVSARVYVMKRVKDL